MSEIKSSYIRGHMTKCMHLIYQEFSNFRRFQPIEKSKQKDKSASSYLPWFTTKKATPQPLVHKCQRSDASTDPNSKLAEGSDCPCAKLGHYIICVAACQNMSSGDLFDFLESNFYYQPNVRMPFSVFLLWVQLEISKGNFEFASECLVK